MKIEILGTGCPKCKKVAEHTEQAVKESGIEAEIVKVTEIADIMKRGVMLTPSLAIEGEIKSSGKIPSVEEIKKWLKR
ncbi:TM0996/MTH895 family glutaredoxin-like protein [bacterium]|nr:TM0996/MTH895 family glutaredoxin-like protein [bacterium]